MTHPDPNNPIGAALGHFQIEALLGQGGMGAAYRARHLKSGRPVAIKTILNQGDQRSRELFLREARALAMLNHPGIVQLLDFGVVQNTDAAFAPGTLYLAMEFVDGGEIRSEEFSDYLSLESLLLQILDALAHAHSRHRIHLDLKPENILKRKDRLQRFKLADFGISRITTDFDEAHPASGTALYIAPEQAQGAWRRIGPWTDLYTLGCIAWEIAAGVPPFTGTTAMSVILARLTGELPQFHPRFPVPEGLESWLRTLLSLECRRRYPSAASAALALLDVGRDWTGDAQNPAFPDARSASSPALKTVRLTSLATRCLDEMIPLELANTLIASPATTPESSRHREPEPLSHPRPAFPDTWKGVQDQRLFDGLDDLGLGLFDLRPPPFVGREDAMDRIWREARHTFRNAETHYVAISGPPGTGKTRLADKIAMRLVELGLARELRFDFGERHWQDAISEGLSRFFNVVGASPDEIDEALLFHLPDLHSRDLKRFRTLLLPHRNRGNPDFFPLLLSLLHRIADRAPLVIVADGIDLEPLAFELLQALQGGDEEAALFAMLLVSKEGRSSPLVFSHYRALPIHRRVELKGFSDQEVQAALKALFPLAPSNVSRLVDHVDGDLHFARQILAHWLERDALFTLERGYGGPAALPDDPERLWLTRLRDFLGSSLQPVLFPLQIASAMGQVVDRDIWRRACAELQTNADEAMLLPLFEKGFLIEDGHQWRFSDFALRDALFHLLDEEKQKEVHRCLARHFLKREDRYGFFRGLRCLEAAGEKTAFAKNLVKLDKFLTLRDSNLNFAWQQETLQEGAPKKIRTEQADIQLRLALNHIQNCEFERADQSIAHAWESWGDHEPDWNFLRDVEHIQATRALFACEPEESIAPIRRILGQRHRFRDPADTSSDQLLADLYIYSSQFADAYRALAEAARIAADQPLELLWIEYRIAQIELFCQELDQTGPRLEHLIGGFARHDDPFGVMLARELLGHYHFLTGDYPGAEELFQTCLIETRRLGYQGEITIHERLGRLYSWWKKPEKALEHLSKVRAVVQARGHNILFGYFYDAEALAYAHMSRPNRIEALALEAEKSGASIGPEQLLIEATWEKARPSTPPQP